MTERSHARGVGASRGVLSKPALDGTARESRLSSLCTRADPLARPRLARSASVARLAVARDVAASEGNVELPGRRETEDRSEPHTRDFDRIVFRVRFPVARF